ncbi:MAG: SpoIIE family protein phosphatase [Oscillospiraceae bacterium]|nr:SpoIIE family protein phosphatase [Oscillospiraceae bacterium]
MKEFIKGNNLSKSIGLSEIGFAVISHIGVSLLTFIASRAVILNTFTPFGISFLAGAPTVYTAAAAIGSFISYFLPAIEGGAFRYIASIFAVISIKLLLSGYKKIIQNPIFLSALSFSVNLITSLISMGSDTYDLPLKISEALISAGGTFFIAKAFRALADYKAGLNHEELVSFITVICILLMGFADVDRGGIMLSHILSVILILVSAKFGKILGGSVSGIAVAFSFLLCGNYNEFTLCYAIGGLIAGVFSSFGKYAQVLSIIFSCFIGVSAIGFNISGISLIIEAALGGAIFLSLPKSANIYIARLFSAGPKFLNNKPLKNSIILRLNTASSALLDVSQTVEQVSRELSKINTPDYNTLITKVENETCKGCNLRVHCWEKRRDSTVDAIFEMTKAVKTGEASPETFTNTEFKERCHRLNKIGSSVSKHYSSYASKIAAERRIEEVRGVVTDQFEGISKMLSDLAADFKLDQKFDANLAATATSALKNLNLIASESSAITDKFGRTSLEFKIEKKDDTKINKMQIMKLLSVICERDFDVPIVSEVGNFYIVRLFERAVFDVDLGVCQVCAEGSSMCGDAYNSFNDGRGHFIIILSDGMGTGGRAAVDGAMASGLMMRLLKAGFGYDCSLKILNSSMLFKSTDESLATLDIVSIDLFTGAVELYKAGAAPTLIRRSGRVGKAESKSLPAGILRDIGFDYAKIRVKNGDVLVILSDGAVSDGTDWIRTELETAKDISASALAERICNRAERLRGDQHRDDITVITACIEKHF